MTTRGRTRRRNRLAWLVGLLVVVAACSPSASVSPGPGDTGAPQPTHGGTSPGPVAEASSATKIAAAEQAGTIDHDTALVDQVYAALDYASLPAAYQSSNPVEPDATSVLAELSGRLDQMSPDLRARTEPFFLRPTDPASFWQKRLSPAAAGAIRLVADTPTIGMEFIDADVAPVRIWYATPLGTSERGLAVQLADEIDASKMWDREKVAMLGHVPCTDLNVKNDGGSSRLDIYLVYPGTGLDWGGRKDSLVNKGKVANGVNITDGAGDSTCPVATHIILNASLDFAHLKSTTAHELFHAFQFSFKNSILPDRDWFMEATATWAKDLVYPDQNFEQDYLEGAWSDVKGPEGPIDSTADTAAYGTYLLPFYLVQKSGDSTGKIVGRLWQASETQAPLQAVGNLPGWMDSFKEFALWNWNKDSVIKYKDAGTPISSDNLNQRTSCIDSHVAGGDTCTIKKGQTILNLSLDHTSVQYYQGIPDRPAVEKLTFDLSDVRNTPNLGVQAILTIGGKTTVEDWTGRDERKFCLNSEDLTKVVLVTSYSEVDPAQTAQALITIQADPLGCSTGHYSIDVSNVGGGHRFGSGHHEADGDVECSHIISTGEWLARAVYLPDQPGDAGRDVDQFDIDNTPGHESVDVGIKGDPSDSPVTWDVMTDPHDPTITVIVTVNDQVHPVTITGVGDDKSQHIRVVATCSQLNEAP